MRDEEPGKVMDSMVTWTKQDLRSYLVWQVLWVGTEHGEAGSELWLGAVCSGGKPRHPRAKPSSPSGGSGGLHVIGAFQHHR